MATERRKADRIKMAEALYNLAQQFGFEACITKHGECYMGKDCTMVEMKFPQGLALNVDFDGKSCQPDVFVLPWHIHQGDARLSTAFEMAAGNVNPYHRHKATGVCYGFENLTEYLETVFTCIQHGFAFEQA